MTTQLKGGGNNRGSIIRFINEDYPVPESKLEVSARTKKEAWDDLIGQMEFMAKQFKEGDNNTKMNLWAMWCVVVKRFATNYPSIPDVKRKIMSAMIERGLPNNFAHAVVSDSDTYTPTA